MKKLFSVIIAAFLLFTLVACSNTWEGIKKDSKEIGKSIGEATKNAGNAIKGASE